MQTTTKNDYAIENTAATASVSTLSIVDHRAGVDSDDDKLDDWVTESENLGDEDDSGSSESDTSEETSSDSHEEFDGRTAAADELLETTAKINAEAINSVSTEFSVTDLTSARPSERITDGASVVHVGEPNIWELAAEIMDTFLHVRGHPKRLLFIANTCLVCVLAISVWSYCLRRPETRTSFSASMGPLIADYDPPLPNLWKALTPVGVMQVAEYLAAKPSRVSGLFFGFFGLVCILLLLLNLVASFAGEETADKKKL